MKDNIGLRMEKPTPRLVHIETDGLIILVNPKQHRVVHTITIGCYAVIKCLSDGLSVRVDTKDAFLPWDYLEALPIDKEEEP